MKKMFTVLIILLSLALSQATFANSIIIRASASPESGGTIAPSGKVLVDYGGNQTFTIIPNTGYELADVKVDGVSKGKINTYTFTNVTIRHSIQAKFKIKTYSITINGGKDCKISPSGVKTATYGKRINFTVKPNASDTVPRVIVDGEEVELTKAGKRYKFTLEVTGNHVVMATSVITPVIPETTQVLDHSTMQNLSFISQDGSVLTFAQPTPILQSLLPGDLIVSGSTASALDGLFRKVTKVSEVGGQIVVETTGATIEEAIENGQIQVSKTLTPNDVSSVVELRKGVSLQRHIMLDQALEGFYFELKDVILYDHDGNLSSENDQIRANGSISLNPSFNFYIEVDNFQLRNLTFTSTMVQKTELEFVAEFPLLEINKKVEIARLNFSPITVMIGWLPVIIVPELTVNVGVRGDVSAGITSKVTQEAELTAGLSYNNGNWIPISTFFNNFGFDPPSLSANADVKAYVGPQLNLLIYGVTGPYAEIIGYLDLEADLFSDPWWELYGGLEADVGIRAEVLGKTIIDYELPGIIGYRLLLAQASSPTPNPWLSFVQGDPGIPGDGIYINNPNWLQLSSPLYLEKFPKGFTITIFASLSSPGRDDYFSLILDSDLPWPCSGHPVDPKGYALFVLSGGTPTFYNGVKGYYINITRSDIEYIIKLLRNYQPCGTVTPCKDVKDVYISALTLGFGNPEYPRAPLDAAAILPGQNAVP